MGEIEPALRQSTAMNEPSPASPLAVAAAEEILRTIYGDDFAGCNVTLDQIAEIAGRAMKQQEIQGRDLLELYEKVIEALDLLSTPPVTENITDPTVVPKLLSERLDAVHAITTKTIQTTALVKIQRPDKPKEPS